MEQRRHRRHQAQQRALAVCRGLRRFFAKAPGGRTTVGALKRAVAIQTARYAAQEQCRIAQKTAADRGRNARRFLYVGLRHVSVVSDRVATRGGDAVPVFSRPSWTSDAALIARADAVLAAAAPHEERFVTAGLQHGFLGVLAAEIAALKQAKDDVTRARARFVEAAAAFDRALQEGKAALAVLDGLLVTAKDAPAGALTALRQQKRIGVPPRPRNRRRSAEAAPVVPPRVVQIALYFKPSTVASIRSAPHDVDASRGTRPVRLSAAAG